MVQLGWKAGTEQYPPDELLEYAIAAEAAGFAAIDVNDHFHLWSERGQAGSVWGWLGAVAVRTSAINLGTGVTCPTLRYYPAVITQPAATMGCFAPGRFCLGVGTGEGLITVGGEAPEPYRQTLENFAAGAREAGKDPAKMSRMVELAVAYTGDEARAIEYRKTYWAAVFVPALFIERIYTPTMAEANGKVVGADTIGLGETHGIFVRASERAWGKLRGSRAMRFMRPLIASLAALAFAGRVLA